MLAIRGVMGRGGGRRAGLYTGIRTPTRAHPRATQPRCLVAQPHSQATDPPAAVTDQRAPPFSSPRPRTRAPARPSPALPLSRLLTLFHSLTTINQILPSLSLPLSLSLSPSRHTTHISIPLGEYSSLSTFLTAPPGFPLSHPLIGGTLLLAPSRRSQNSSTTIPPVWPFWAATHTTTLSCSLAAPFILTSPSYFFLPSFATFYQKFTSACASKLNSRTHAHTHTDILFLFRKDRLLPPPPLPPFPTYTSHNG